MTKRAKPKDFTTTKIQRNITITITAEPAIIEYVTNLVVAVIKASGTGLVTVDEVKMGYPQ